MAPLPHRFTALATAVVVFLAHVACVCPAAHARAAADVEQPAPAATHCCKHETSARGGTGAVPPGDGDSGSHGSHDGKCRHCSADAAVAAALTHADRSRDLASAGPAFEPFAPALGALVPGTLTLEPRRGSADPSPSPAMSPPTLLGLRCALNL